MLRCSTSTSLIIVQKSSSPMARGSGCVTGRGRSYHGDEGQLDVLHAAERV